MSLPDQISQPAEPGAAVATAGDAGRRTGNGSGPSGRVVLERYRAAVDDVVAELATCLGPGDAGTAEAILARRLGEPDLVAVLAGTPGGADQTAQALLREVRGYRPSPRSSARSLAALVRIALLTQIDVLWWGRAPAYQRDADLLADTDLVDLAAERRAGRLAFRYRRQAVRLPARAVRAASRRLAPHRYPRTAGLRFTRARPEAVALLNDLAAEFTRRAPADAPPLWVTSLARSVEHQHRLRALGYAALLPSSHCAGYGMDIEMAWLARFGAQDALRGVLLDRQAAGDVNVISEGQAWHVCLAPHAAMARRRPGPQAAPAGDNREPAGVPREPVPRREPDPVADPVTVPGGPAGGEG